MYHLSEEHAPASGRLWPYRTATPPPQPTWRARASRRGRTQPPPRRSPAPRASARASSSCGGGSRGRAPLFCRRVLLQEAIRGAAEESTGVLEFHSYRSAMVTFLKTTLPGASIPYALDVVDALAAGVSTWSFADYFQDDKLLKVAAKVGRPEVILRLLWRGGFIEPTYRNGEGLRSVAYDVARARRGEDIRLPMDVVCQRVSSRPWRVVGPVPFALDETVRVWFFKSNVFSSLYGKACDDLDTLCLFEENERLIDLREKPVQCHTALHEEAKVEALFAFCEDVLSVITVLSALQVMPRTKAAGAKRQRDAEAYICWPEERRSTTPATHASLGMHIMRNARNLESVFFLRHMLIEGLPIGSTEQIVETIRDADFWSTNNDVGEYMLNILECAGLLDADALLASFRASGRHSPRYSGIGVDYLMPLLRQLIPSDEGRGPPERT